MNKHHLYTPHGQAVNYRIYRMPTRYILSCPVTLVLGKAHYSVRSPPIFMKIIPGQLRLMKNHFIIHYYKTFLISQQRMAIRYSLIL